MRIGAAEIDHYTKKVGKRAFYFLILLKRDNPRGFIYSENIPVCYQRYGISKSTFYRYINTLISDGLIVKDGKGNLALKSIDIQGKKKSFYRNRIKVEANDSLKTIERKLQADQLNRRLKQCRFMSKLKEESVQMEQPNGKLKMYKTVRSLRKAQKKFIKDYDKNPDVKELTPEPRLKMSDIKAASMLGVSEKTYNSKVKKELKAMGLVFWSAFLIQMPQSAKCYEGKNNISFIHKGKAYMSYTEYLEPKEEVEEIVYKPYISPQVKAYKKMWEEIEKEESENPSF